MSCLRTDTRPQRFDLGWVRLTPLHLLHAPKPIHYRYFNEILEQTPESVEDVMVEADGQWHTSDNKYGSAEWIASHRPQVKPPSPVKKQPTSPDLSRVCLPGNGNASSMPPVSISSNGGDKVRHDPVYVLDDSDDEVEGALAYPSSTSQSYDSRPPPQTQSQSQTQSSNVIDLTLDSDDDDAPIVQSNTYGKRKATEVSLDNPFLDQSWKKARMDPSRVLPVPRVSSAGSINGIAPVLSSPSVNNHLTASPPARMSSFAGNTLPPPAPYPNYSRHGSSNPSLQLPPLNNYPSRQSQNTRWP